MKRFKALSIMLVLLIVSLTIIPSFASSEETTVINPIQSDYSNELNKIHFYFGSAEENETSGGVSVFSRKLTANEEDYSYIDDEEEIVNAVENMNTFCEQNDKDEELIRVTVEFKSRYESTPEFIAFSEEKETLETMEDVRNFRKRLNAFSKQYHQQENEKNIELLEQFDYESITLVGYAPFVVMKITRDNIIAENLVALAENDMIANVSLGLKEESIEDVSWTNTLKEIEAYSTVDSGLHTGEGVRVGVYEANAVCDTSNVNLSDKRITIDSRCNNSAVTTEQINHANIVVSIATLIAPDAEFFVSSYDDPEGGIQWFIDNECDVVNCSFSYYGNAKQSDGTYVNQVSGYRYDIDGLYDRQIRNNFITVVTTSSNKITDNTKANYNPNGEIHSPGLSFNSITVGGLERKLGFLEYYLQHADGAGYKSTLPYAKPEVSAIFDVTVPNIGSYSGTSLAVPQVTGTIALLFERMPNFSTPTVNLKALIMSCANKTEDYEATYGGFDDKVGAGCLDLYEMENANFIAYRQRTASMNDPNNNIEIFTINVPKNSEIQASIAWFAEVDCQSNEHYITNYDLRLYNASGELVSESALDSNSNVELIRYTAPTSGAYAIAIYQNGDMPLPIETDYVGIAYNYTE